jgi:biotin operon repressor
MRRRQHSGLMIDRQWGMPTSLGSRIPLASLIQTLAVAEYLSFYRAAQALGTSQSSVSARIGALEEELGILLFERNTRGVRLTEAGRLFVERVSAGIAKSIPASTSRSSKAPPVMAACSFALVSWT